MHKLKYALVCVLAFTLTIIIGDMSVYMSKAELLGRIDANNESLSVTLDYNIKHPDYQGILKVLKKEKLTYYGLSYKNENNLVYHIHFASMQNEEEVLGHPFDQVVTYRYGQKFGTTETIIIQPFDDAKKYDEIIVNGENLAPLSDKLKSLRGVMVDSREVHNEVPAIKLTDILKKEPLLLGIMILVLILCMGDLFCRRQRFYALKKLHGYALPVYMIKESLRSLCLSSVVFIISSLLTRFLLVYDNDNIIMGKYLLALLGLLLALMVLIHVIMILFASSLSILSQMKEIYQYRLYDLLIKPIMAVVMVILAMQLTVSVATAYRYSKQVHTLSVIEEKTRGMFRIDSYKQGVNLSHKGWSKMVDQTNEMVQKQGALYIDADNYTSKGREKGLGEILERIPKGIRVNGAMIQLFAIKDEQGIVHLDRKRNYQKHPLFLIPQKYKDQVWLNDAIQDYHAEVDYIPNHQKIYSFNTDVNVKEDGWIEDPIMVIDSREDFNNYMVPITPYKSVQEVCAHYGIGNVINYEQPASKMKQYVTQTKTLLMKTIAYCLLYLVLAFFTLYELVYVYFINHALEIVLKRIHGQKTLKMYAGYYTQLIGFFIIVMIILRFVLHSNMAIVTTVFLLIISSILSMIMQNKIVSSHIVATLKGGISS